MIAFESERILLGPLTKNDWDIFLVHLNMSNEHYYQYGCEDKEELFESINEPVEGVIYYSIKSRETEEMLGYVGITPEIKGEPYNNLEFYIFQEYRRKGYAYEAISIIVDEYLKGSLTGNVPQEIMAETLEENTTSIALLEKLGFVEVAVGARLLRDADEQYVIGVKRFIFKNTVNETELSG